VSVGVVEGHCGGNVLGILEFSNATFEAEDSLAHYLSASLALSIVVFAGVGLLGSCTLLASWLNAITFLR
jgi:hypothetical protein